MSELQTHKDNLRSYDVNGYELSEGCFFSCALDGTIVIECLGEEVDFAFGMSDDGLGGFGRGVESMVTWHRNAKG